MPKTLHGRFRPKNPNKYKGNTNEIYYRSSWERTFMKWVDINESVLQWGSEEFFVPYYDPIQKKQRRYFPDFILKVRESDGLIVTKVVEVKPYAQTQCPPTNPARRTKAWMNKVQTYVTNQAKWEATKALCTKKGWEFMLVTEYELGLKKRK